MLNQQINFYLFQRLRKWNRNAQNSLQNLNILFYAIYIFGMEKNHIFIVSILFVVFSLAACSSFQDTRYILKVPKPIGQTACILSIGGQCQKCQSGFELVKGRCSETEKSDKSNIKLSSNKDIEEIKKQQLNDKGSYSEQIEDQQMEDTPQQEFRIKEAQKHKSRNCIDYHHQSNRCYQCASGFIIDRKGHCKKNKKGDTRIFNSSKTKEIMNILDEIDQLINSMIPKKLNCMHPFVKVNNKCVIRGCSSSNATSCLVCMDPFVLNSSTCFISNCLIYDNRACIGCNSTFMLTLNGTCVPYIPNCLNQSNSTCNNCQNGFLLANNTCVVNVTSSNNKNSICKAPLVVSTNGTCLPAIPNCLSQTNQVCNQCNVSYILSSNNCTLGILGGVYIGKVLQACAPPFTLSDKSCIILGCLNLTSKGCSQCIPPYTLTSNSSCAIPNCLVYSTLISICTYCINNYISASNGSCVPEIKNCAIQKDSDCLLCDTGHHYNTTLSACVRLIQQTYANKTLVDCVLPYSYISNSCFIPNCLKHSKLGCQKCKAPSVLASNFTCFIPNCLSQKLNQSSCVICNKGFLLTSLFECVLIIQQCAVQKDSQCINCASGYHLNSNASMCLLNSVGTVYNGSKIVACKLPWILSNNGTCIIQGCLNYSLNGCSKCIPPFIVFEDSGCYIQGCDSLSADQKTCKICKKGWVPATGGFCIQGIPNCMKQNDSQCQTCNLGYFLVSNNSVCQVNAQFNNNGSISSCIIQLFYPNQLCLIEGCTIYNSSGCQTCHPSFEVQKSHLHFVCQMPGCLILSTTPIPTCTQCQSNYERNSSGFCHLKIPYCHNQVNNHCQMCNPGYAFTKFQTTCIPTKRIKGRSLQFDASNLVNALQILNGESWIEELFLQLKAILR